MRFGILDVCPVNDRLACRDSLLLTSALAQRAEQVGFSRYWIAEHHGPDVAHSAPEVLLPALAAVTDRMRVGVAGVLLRNHNPLRVAQAFRLLECLHPGRIDLGMGAGHAPPEVAAALGASPPGEADPYEQRLAEVICYLEGRSPLAVPPAVASGPQLWVLGSSGLRGPRLAARHGTSFSQALFIGRGGPEPTALAEYRRLFRERWPQGEPCASVAVAGVCASTDQDAARILATRSSSAIRPTLVGGPEHCRTVLEEINQAFSPDELVFLDLAEAPEDRLRTLDLLAEVMKLDQHGGQFPQRPAPRELPANSAMTMSRPQPAGHPA